MSREYTREDLEKDVKTIVEDALEPVRDVLMLARTVIENPPTKEVTKTPKWIEENINTIANLAEFETEEQLLAKWREAKEIKRKKEDQKIVMEALEHIAAAGFVTETKEETTKALEQYEDKIKGDMLAQAKRSFSSPSRIESELNTLLSPYRPKFETVKKALSILQLPSYTERKR